MTSPNNETMTKEGSLEQQRTQYYGPNFHTPSKKSSRQSIGDNEQLVPVTREHGGASNGGQIQRSGEMHSFAGSAPMLERWQREKAKDGPFNNIDAVVQKKYNGA